MTEKINLTIEEIVSDFEGLIRLDERLNLKLDSGNADKSDLEAYNSRLREIVQKYIPNYRKHLKCSEVKSYEASLEIYGMLYENFREIFSKLI